MSYEFRELDADGIDILQFSEPSASNNEVWAEARSADGFIQMNVSDGSNWYDT